MFEVIGMGLSFLIGLVSLVVLTDSVLRWMSAYKGLQAVLQQDYESELIGSRVVAMPRMRPAVPAPLTRVTQPRPSVRASRSAA
jgi:hypothetical protein